MKTIIYTLLSFVFSTLSIGQSLDCINNLTVGLAENEVIQIFAVDFLVTHDVDPGEDVFSEKFVLSLDGGEGMAITDIDEIGVYSYIIVNTETNQSCEGTLIVQACEDCAGPVSNNSGNLRAVCNSSITVQFPEKETIELSDIDAGTNSPNRDLVLSISSDSQYEFLPDDPGFIPQTIIQLVEDDICTEVIVRLFAADSEGNVNVCWTEVLVGSADNDCGFSSADCFSKCEDFVPLDPNTIKWPAPYGPSDLKTYELNCDGLEAKELSTGYLTCSDAFMALPSWCETGCGLVGYSLEEIINEGKTNSCKNVSRIWTIIDWCTFDPFVTPNNDDQYAIIADKRSLDCKDCSGIDIGDVYVSYLDVKQDGFYTFDQNIEIEEDELISQDNDLTETDVPVNITLINGVPDVYPFSLSINDQIISESENGFLFISESALIENDNIISLSSIDNGEILNGVSTLDVVLVVQHILGIRELNPHQVVAADLDKSGSISLAKDLLKMRALILGIDSEIIGEDWFLVEANHDFNDFNKDDFENDFSQFEFEKSELNMDEGLNFNIYKYGDVNDSYSLTRSEDKANLKFENVQLQKDKEHSISLTLSSADLGSIIGAQFSIILNDASILSVEHAYGKDLQYHIVDNVIRFSFVSKLSVDELEISIKLNSQKHQLAKNTIKLEEGFIREFITEDYGIYDIELNTINIQSFEEASVDPSALIYPNPASSFLNINVPNSFIGQDIKIYNVNGQLELKTEITKSNRRIFIDNKLTKGIKIVKIEGLENQKIMVL